MTSKFPRGEPWTKNFSAVSYIDLQDRPAFKMAIHRNGDRWFLYAAHFWESGYSIVEITDPSQPRFVRFVSGPPNTWATPITATRCRSGRSFSQRAENLKGNQIITERFADLSRKKGVTPAQLALAWLLARGDDILPIPGSRRLEAVKENIAALNNQLTASEMAEIDSNLPAAKGERYGAPMMAALDT